MYVCDPATSGQHCDDPFTPSKSSNTAGVDLDPNSGGGSPSGVVGVGTLQLGASAANALYAAVAGPSSSVSEFELSASVGQAYYLSRPSDASVQVESDGSLTIAVSWKGA